MITFTVIFFVLLLGYFFYGRLTEKVFSPDDRQTPALRINDGVDCVPLKPWKAYLIELLNIAGTGPIFGAIMGATFGPVVLLWIVLGSILGGAVHDYMTGMISSRHDGATLGKLSEIYFGKIPSAVIKLVLILLCILAGAVFVTSPAALLSQLTPDYMTTGFWVVVILIYYTLATFLPIDKIIGKLYPVFGILLLGMALAVFGAVVFSPDYTLPELTLSNLHPEGKPVFPFMFITVACGAISGFHATQNPIIAKCITSEKQGRRVFYGAMMTETVIALAWAAAGVVFYESSAALNSEIAQLGQSGVVYNISMGLLGKIGGLLAVIGVIVCPISSGDTCFRSSRLMVGEWLKLDQKPLKNRIFITIPLLLIGAALTQLDFDILWRYFSWANQTLAMLGLYISSEYLMRNCKKPVYSLITALPGVFMAYVTMAYIMAANEGFRLPVYLADIIGICFAVLVLAVYLIRLAKTMKKRTLR